MFEVTDSLGRIKRSKTTNFMSNLSFITHKYIYINNTIHAVNMNFSLLIYLFFRMTHSREKFVPPTLLRIQYYKLLLNFFFFAIYYKTL